MNDSVALSIRQMDGAWRLMCAGGSRYVAAASAGVQYIFSGVPISFFNIAVLTGSGLSADALRARGREACAWAAAHDVPWLLILTHELLEPGVDVAATLDACGLVPVMTMTGMSAGSVGGAPAVPGLQLTTPQEDRDCAALLDVNGLAYEMDMEAGKSAIGSRAFWKDHFPVLGRFGGMPVSSAAVLMVDGVRYVALVATRPDHHRRGFADSTMRQALANAAAAHGEALTVLHATDAGRPVYERMGYAPISTHTLLMDKRFVEAQAGHG
jgi:GNAT superfamily N-acetyltransferase